MTLTTAPCMLPYSADAPTDWICTSWMKSMPGSARATPLHGQVKLVPSKRNWFSLVPEPNADTVVTVPLEGDVGEIPGAALIMSNMLDRRVGMARWSSGPKRVPKPGSLASMREPAPSTTTDSAKPAPLQDDRAFDGGASADGDVRHVQRRKPRRIDVERIPAGRQGREAQAAPVIGRWPSPTRQ